MTRIDLLESEIKNYLNLGLTVIPLRCRSKKPLVRWGSGWNPSIDQLHSYFNRPANVGVLCGGNLAVLDCDSEDAYFGFITTHEIPRNCPVVKTGGKPIFECRVGSSSRAPSCVPKRHWYPVQLV